MTASAEPQRLLGPGLLFATGAAALVFESAAVRVLTRYVGGTVEATAVGVAVFVGALALGSELFGRIAARSLRPERLFAALALGAGVWIACIPLLVRAVDALGLAPSFDDARALQIAVDCVLALIVVAPAALLLGGTLPAIAAAAPRVASTALLAAANTAGAVLGALAFGFVLLEKIGLRASLWAAALVLVAAGVSAWLYLRESAAPANAEDDGDARAMPGAASLLAFVGGVATLAFEVLAFRVLIQFLPSSTPLLALVLALFVLGLALGNALSAALARDAAKSIHVAASLLAWLGPALLLVPLAACLHDRSGDMFGVSRPGWISILTVSVLPGAIVSGAAFGALLCGTGRGHARAARAGRLLGVNAAGNVIGSLAATFWLLPALGVQRALIAVAAVPTLVGFVAALAARAPVRIVAALAALGCAAGLATVDPRLLPEHPNFPLILAHVDGPEASVTVAGSKLSGRPALILDRRRMQGGGSGLRTERRQGLLPLALCGEAQTALVLGVGTGATMAALHDAGVPDVTGVELVRGVLDALPLFDEGRGSLRSRPGCTLVEGDATAYVRQTSRTFDLVVGDLYFPDSAGAGALYSREHFEAVRRRLTEHGMFMQWLPLHQMKFTEFGLVARTFADVFPTTLMFLADADADQPIVGLLGATFPVRWRERGLATRMSAPRSRGTFEDVGLNTPTDVFAMFRGDRDTIEAQFTIPGDDKANAERNTLDRPLVELRVANTPDGETRLAQANWRLVRDRLADTFFAYLEFETPAVAANGTASGSTQTPISEASRKMRDVWTATNWVLLAQVARIEREVRVAAHNADPLEAEREEIRAYLFGLQFDPTNVLLNRRVNEVSKRCALERRIADMEALDANVVTINPENAQAVRDLGLAQLLLGKIEAAAGVLDAATKKHPDAALELRMLGVARFLLGDADAARAALAQAKDVKEAKPDPFLLADCVDAELSGQRARALEWLALIDAKQPSLAGLARQVREKLQ